MGHLRNLDRYARKLLDDVRSLEIPQDLLEQFGRYVDDPVAFVNEILGAAPQPYQIEVLEAAVDNPRIAWRAGHGVGKTTTLAWLLLWWLCTRPYSRVLVLAPAFERQVGRYLFPEVRKWARNAPEPLPVKVRANTVEIVGFEREWFAIGIQATDSSKVEGAHAENLLVLADEAKGLDAEVVAALHGTQTDAAGDRLYVLASVPGGPSGPFYDVFRKGPGLWKLFHTPASDSSLVSPTWIKERALEWGDQSPLYLARVEGEFPDEAEGTLLRLADLEAAVGREIEHDSEPRLTFGIDIARFGDDRSAIGVWRGNELIEVMTRRSLDTMEVASWIASEINRRNPDKVRIDEIGIGSGVVDRLKQMGHYVDAVNVSRRADKPELYQNERAAMFWRLREALEKGEISLPNDEALIAELSSLRYSYDPKGRIVVEKKELAKRRIGRSPDLADAVALGYLPGGYVGCAFAYLGGQIWDVRTCQPVGRL